MSDPSLEALLQAAFDVALRGGDPEADALPIPLQRAIEHAVTFASFKEVVAGDSELRSQVAARLARVVGEEWSRLSRIRVAEPAMPTGDLRHILESCARRFPDAAAEWSLLAETLDRCNESDESLVRALERRAAAMWHRQIGKEWRAQQVRNLRKRLTPALSAMNETVPELAAARSRLAETLGFGGNGWDPVEPVWREIEWGALERCAAKIEPSIRRLARIVARGISHPPAEPATPAQNETSPRRRPVLRLRPSGSALQRGLTPSELALLADETTESTGLALFLQRRSQPFPSARDGIAAAPRAVPRPSPPADAPSAPGRVRSEGSTTAPIVICLDTSGSMVGLGTDVSKMFSVAATRYGKRLARTVHLFAATATPLSLDLTRPERSAVAFTRFLDDAILSGSGVAPPLAAALTFLEGIDSLTTADVVVFSDFRFPTLTPSHMSRIFALQGAGGVRFHIVTIHRDPIEDPLNIFDYHWHYETGEIGAPGIAADAFRGL